MIDLWKDMEEVEKKGYLQPKEVLKDMRLLIQMNLIAFRDARNLVDFWYKGRNQIDKALLKEQWDTLFFSLADPEIRWLFSIEKYLPRNWINTKGKYPESPIDIKGASIGKRHLSQEVNDQILD